MYTGNSDSDMCNPDFRINRTDGRSQSLPIHVLLIRIIRILPNPDRNLGSTSDWIQQSCLYSAGALYLTQPENQAATTAADDNAAAAEAVYHM